MATGSYLSIITLNLSELNAPIFESQEFQKKKTKRKTMRKYLRR